MNERVGGHVTRVYGCIVALPDRGPPVREFVQSDRENHPEDPTDQLDVQACLDVIVNPSSHSVWILV